MMEHFALIEEMAKQRTKPVGQYQFRSAVTLF